MSNISPIKGLRPKKDLVDKIVAPPYDVLNSNEARKMAEGNPHTWLHVSKPEIDLDPSIDLYDERVYEKARENYTSFVKSGWFIDERFPAFYIYRLTMDGRSQTGIIAGASAEEYTKGLIKKHELTRADKELDRTKHTEYLQAHTGPVFLIHRATPRIDSVVAEIVKNSPEYDVTTFDGVRNEVWVVKDTEPIRNAFKELPCLYIADGHHRAASYSKIGMRRREEVKNVVGDEPFNFFLSVIFPHDQLLIMPYNRVVKDLNGLTKDEFLKRAEQKFILKNSAPSTPRQKHEISFFLDNHWYGLEPRAGTFDEKNPVKSLDVSILQMNLLEPILGITDPRRDKRIDFVGGIRGTSELEERVRKGEAIAFSLYPTSVEDLLSIADAGEIMPPKSTWFEPKLKDGFVIHRITDS
ncbi:TPA: DUF1015 domain-containing protein, partial [bacterium]|nr:MAG: hypothetical protein AUJ18_00395 [Candidatus Hydrogenedentes bacterium CG1_02_42_14]HBW46730.1 DUF1015 domain-containing protein [bacterium]